MEIGIPVFILKKLTSQFEEDESPYTDYYGKSDYDYEKIIIDTTKIPQDEISHIMKEMSKYDGVSLTNDEINCPVYYNEDRRIQSIQTIEAMISYGCQKYKRFQKLLLNSTNKKITNLKGMVTIVEGFCKTLKNSVFYEFDEEDQIYVPWVLLECNYHPPRTSYGERYPAYVTIKFKAIKLNEIIENKLTFHAKDIKMFNSPQTDDELDDEVDTTENNKSSSMTLIELFELRNLYPQDDELDSIYEKELQKYLKLENSIGSVYIGKNKAIRVKRIQSSWSNHIYRNESNYYFKKLLSENKVVIDNKGFSEEGSESSSSNEVKSLVHSNITASMVKLPVHCFVHCFHLEEHTWLACHVKNLDEYQFAGKELMNKLILPQKHITLIDILMNSSKVDINDIVSGKKGGSFIIATGPPGTGKTLTAEVFSETVELPLYKVQCSQLGIKIDEVEKNLQTILMRAYRWGAILLIDEADVYVRTRGTDIQQNAIVGVFLRTLEYYTGILFMTSNLETSIDDAIMSRATAHLQYFAPNEENLTQIWQVLNESMQTNLTTIEIDKLVKLMPNIVGRDVKSLLKLSKMYASQKCDILDAEFIMKISEFVPNVKNTNNLKSKKDKPIMNLMDLQHQVMCSIHNNDEQIDNEGVCICHCKRNI